MADLELTWSPPRRRFRKVLIAMCGIFGLASANFLYVRAAASWLRSPELARRLNHRPERFRISWREAKSPFPGWLVVRDLELAGRTRRARWSLHADEAHGFLSLPSLLRRRVVVDDLVGAGVVIRVARMLPPGAPPIAGQPPIVPDFPQSAAEFEASLDAPSDRPRWTIELPDVTLERVRELWLERWRFAGAMKAHGGLRLRLRRDAEVFASRLDLLHANLTVVGRPAGVLRGSVKALASPYSPREERGWAAVRHVSGEGRLRGELSSLNFLVGLMPNVPWFSVEGGVGSFTARLLLARGKLGPGSTAKIEARSANVSFLDYQAKGRALLSWQVGRQGAVGRVDLSDCEIRRRGAAAPFARAPKLHVGVTSRDLELDGRLTDIAGEADLPRAEVPDLRTYNAYLPAGSGVEITGGTGVFSTRLKIAPSGRASGAMDLTAKNVAATGRGLTLRGGCRISLALASRDVRSRRFDLDGSRMRCDDVEVRDGRQGTGDPSSTGWWVEGRVLDGVAAAGAENYLSLAGKIQARDALPIFALFGDRPAAKIAALFFREKSIAATGRVDLASASWRAQGEGKAGARLTAAARLSGRRGQIDGALLAGIGKRRIGIELDGAERTIHWRHAADWFAAGESGIRKSGAHR